MTRVTKYFLYLCLILLILASQKLRAQAYAVEQNGVVNSPIEAKLYDLISAENITPYLAYFKKNETVSWQVTLPANYEEKSPQGLLVYISPQDSDEIYEMWKPLLTAKNLIWISADKGGNDFTAPRRVLQALLAVQLVSKNYKLDKQRIYVTGFSGGGRVTSMMAPLYPEPFTGSIFMGGANSWGSKSPEKFALMKNKSYVFISGENDFNLKESKIVSEKFKHAGLSNVEFFEVPGLGHMPPDAKWLGAAIDYLDAHKLNN